jgi:ectoine hydroxylase-related dioxygenase (phytanoyl-CoA dioxygenase family)
MNQLQLQEEGFTVLPDIFSHHEVDTLIDCIGKTVSSGPLFRKTNDLFAIRQFLKELPQTTDLIFSNAFKRIVREYAGEDHFVVKSIYFDKPEGSNWFVAWHQDLTIAVDKRRDCHGFGGWTSKPESFSVQPPADILESMFTFRIHLDDTDMANGALRVIPGSHKKGIIRMEGMAGDERVCAVGKGGVMVMKPLLLHASSRVTNNRQRRVIHIEFCNRQLPDGLNWVEYRRV